MNVRLRKKRLNIGKRSTYSPSFHISEEKKRKKKLEQDSENLADISSLLFSLNNSNYSFLLSSTNNNWNEITLWQILQ
jgi:hypothetical protein